MRFQLAINEACIIKEAFYDAKYGKWMLPLAKLFDYGSHIFRLLNVRMDSFKPFSSNFHSLRFSYQSYDCLKSIMIQAVYHGISYIDSIAISENFFFPILGPSKSTQNCTPTHSHSFFTHWITSHFLLLFTSRLQWHTKDTLPFADLCITEMLQLDTPSKGELLGMWRKTYINCFYL